MNDLERTKHYSKNELLLDGLKDFFINEEVIEPFYGKGDLVKDFNVVEFYDIDFPKNSKHYRNSLINPPLYDNKIVITNPPYLAKNKAKDKTIFKQYKYDDLYKIAMATMLNSAGGILIIPLNFFTDEKSKDIREEFLKRFKVLRLNVYLDKMFDETSYNVCSFAFIKQNNISQIIPTYIYQDERVKDENLIKIEKVYSYRVGGEFFNKINSVENIFSRITVDKKENPTFISVICIDKKDSPLHFYFSEDFFYGKQSDRNIATLSTDIEISKDKQQVLIDKANELISNFREENLNLVFTNFRDRGRKRIGFSEAYKIMSLVYKENCK